MGFNNNGLDAFVANIKRSNFQRQRQSAAPGKTPRMLLGLNIGKNAVTPIERAKEDYLICLDRVYPYADYVSINISSPNTKNLRALQQDEALDELLGALAQRRETLTQRHGKRTPIFVKIAPDLDPSELAVLAAGLTRHGMDGVIATNTTIGRDAVKNLAHADEAGGLSGAPLLAPSNRIITQLRAALGQSYPIIGVGGIMSAADALSKIRAGADVVQIYTGLIYQGPALVAQVANLIKQSYAGMT